ncbi:MAG TPA: alpha/beta hydrolase [Anaerolineaceae bacterium]|nr:alpha/beta hydrolase [Anaerolineaceae bacterium]
MKTQFLQVPDGTIAYEETGHGPLLVCAPSMGDLRGEYRFLAPLLAGQGFRVASLDVRGHGQSSVRWPDYSVAGVGADMLALARALDLNPAVLVGTSMAGGAAVWAAVENPERVRGIVLIDPFARNVDTNPLMALLFRVLFSRPWGAAAWQRYYRTLYPTRKPDDFASYSAALRANLTERGRLEALQAMLAASKAASEERLDRVSVPAMVLMGEKDPDFKDPAGEARLVAGRIHARVALLPNAGHYPHAEFPEETASQILSFLQTITEMTGAGHAA